MDEMDVLDSLRALQQHKARRIAELKRKRAQLSPGISGNSKRIVRSAVRERLAVPIEAHVNRAGQVPSVVHLVSPERRPVPKRTPTTKPRALLTREKNYDELLQSLHAVSNRFVAGLEDASAQNIDMPLSDWKQAALRPKTNSLARVQAAMSPYSDAKLLRRMARTYDEQKHDFSLSAATQQQQRIARVNLWRATYEDVVVQLQAIVRGVQCRMNMGTVLAKLRGEWAVVALQRTWRSWLQRKRTKLQVKMLTILEGPMRRFIKRRLPQLREAAAERMFKCRLMPPIIEAWRRWAEAQVMLREGDSIETADRHYRRVLLHRVVQQGWILPHSRVTAMRSTAALGARRWILLCQVAAYLETQQFCTWLQRRWRLRLLVQARNRSLWIKRHALMYNLVLPVEWSNSTHQADCVRRAVCFRYGTARRGRALFCRDSAHSSIAQRSCARFLSDQHVYQSCGRGVAAFRIRLALERWREFGLQRRERLQMADSWATHHKSQIFGAVNGHCGARFSDLSPAQQAYNYGRLPTAFTTWFRAVKTVKHARCMQHTALHFWKQNALKRYIKNARQ